MRLLPSSICRIFTRRTCRIVTRRWHIAAIGAGLTAQVCAANLTLEQRPSSVVDCHRDEDRRSEGPARGRHYPRRGRGLVSGMAGHFASPYEQ